MAPHPWGDVIATAKELVPGLVGSGVSMLFLKETSWPRRIGSLLAGAAISYYATPWLVGYTNMPAGLTGFLAGLSGLLIVSKLMDIITNIELMGFVTEWIRKWLGTSNNNPPPPNREQQP